MLPVRTAVRSSAAVAALLSSIALAPAASASQTINFGDPSGLAAAAEFELSNPTTLVVRLRNTSTGVPLGFDSSDQLLTTLSWDFGAPGINVGDPQIVGGSVVVGPASQSINFSVLAAGPGDSVGGEYGYGNLNGTGALPNLVSGNVAGVTPFGGPNLDGPMNIDGPQAGLVASPILVALGGLGAIQDEIIFTLTIDQPLADLKFLLDNGVRVEFGSDAAFIQVPEPATATLLLPFAGLLLHRRRR